MSINKLTELDLETLRKQMIKFAQLHLPQPEQAEDMVQESLLIAFQSAHSFQGDSDIKTWVFAILKNKILDSFRRKGSINFSELQQDNEDDITERLFLENGEWNTEVYEANVWQNEAKQVYSAQFWLIFENCLRHLPLNQARVFMMRSYFEMDSDSICQICDISQDYLYVLLYRARLRLQLCLSHQWFGEADVEL